MACYGAVALNLCITIRAIRHAGYDDNYYTSCCKDLWQINGGVATSSSIIKKIIVVKTVVLTTKDRSKRSGERVTNRARYERRRYKHPLNLDHYLANAGKSVAGGHIHKPCIGALHRKDRWLGFSNIIRRGHFIISRLHHYSFGPSKLNTWVPRYNQGTIYNLGAS